MVSAALGNCPQPNRSHFAQKGGNQGDLTYDTISALELPRGHKSWSLVETAVLLSFLPSFPAS